MAFQERDERDARVDITVYVLACGHDRKVSHGRITAAPAYVVAHHTHHRDELIRDSDFDHTLRELICGGHEVKLTRRSVRVGPLTFVQGLPVDAAEAASED